MSFDLQAGLQNESVKAVPLKPSHFDLLYKVASDPLIWEQHPNPDRYKREVFQIFFRGAIESGGAFLVSDAQTKQVIGSSRYYDFDTEADSVSIGYTFFSRSHWGGKYNPALKKLMLNHAFRFVKQVNFHIGAVNLRSQKAIERLGAKKIGELEMEYYGESPKLNFIYQISKSDWEASTPNEFEKYHEKSISNRFFKHKDVLNLLSKLDTSLFSIAEIGKSFQQRSINLIKVGSGETKILLWSQMHGDEATATMALFDLFNFLGDTENISAKEILHNCTLYFIPMLNPDGAEAFTRRNAQGIDINRDFNSQQSPEGRLLRQTRDELQPEFAFNLHDQGSLWSVANTGKPATISLLAPPFDTSQSFNEIRTKAAQVAVCIYKKLQTILPSNVGRWTDEYEPRAFGDNFQRAGSSTILIESGHYKNDFEKQNVRRLTFVSILEGLSSIASLSYKDESLDIYNAIPDNEKRHFNILLRNCRISGDKNYTIDIGIIAEESPNPGSTSVTYCYMVEDLGDLSGFYGYNEVDAEQFTLILPREIACGKPADLILMDGQNVVLAIENGTLSDIDF